MSLVVRPQIATMNEADSLARQWLEESNKKNGELILYDECCDAPEIAWAAILCLLEHELSDDQVSLLAAGPLEDLLAKHGPTFIERVEHRAATDPKFNYLLGGVWRNTMSEEVWERVQAIRKEVW